MSWFMEHGATVLTLLLGGSGMSYGIVMHLLNKRQKAAEARGAEAEADVKGEAFWKNRYDVLECEMKERDTFWHDRYDNLYKEHKEERSLNNDLIKSLRNELNILRVDYENQRKNDKDRYDRLLQEMVTQENRYLSRIDALEKVISDYEKKISNEK